MHVYLEHITHLIFPRYCASCEIALGFHELSICTTCLSRLPRARIHEDRGNKIERLFWGRCNVHMATSFLRMTRKGMAQRLIHELKYENNPHVGETLGKLLGGELKKSPSWADVDALIPVPLHPKKELERGYNQSFKIAIGMTQTMGVPTLSKAIQRKIYTQSQTKKSRMSRWENVEDIFQLNVDALQSYKHVIVVDDVITTGSTIEACVQTIHQELNIKVSVVSLAMPVR